MPIVTEQPLLTRPEQLVEYFYDKLSGDAATLGLQFVGSYDENLIPEYPAVVITAGPVEKELHGTATFLFRIRLLFYVMHGDLTKIRRIRNKEDLEFASNLVEYLERDMKLADDDYPLGRVIQGWVESEVPTALPPRTTKGRAIVSTRLHWVCLSEGRFNVT